MEIPQKNEDEIPESGYVRIHKMRTQGKASKMREIIRILRERDPEKYEKIILGNF